MRMEGSLPDIGWTNTDRTEAILEHMSTHHHIATVPLDEFSSNIKIIKVIPDFKKLIIYKALTILHNKLDLNRQIDNF